MSASQQITVTLPQDIADLIRSKVSAGEFASESELLQASLIDFLLPPTKSSELEAWLKTEGVRRYQNSLANPQAMLTADEMYAAIEEELDAIRHEK